MRDGTIIKLNSGILRGGKMFYYRQSASTPIGCRGVVFRSPSGAVYLFRLSSVTIVDDDVAPLLYETDRELFYEHLASTIYLLSM